MAWPATCCATVRPVRRPDWAWCSSTPRPRPRTAASPRLVPARRGNCSRRSAVSRQSALEAARMVETHRSVLGTDDVTVVVVTRNRRRRLAETLRSLRHLPERPPVVVVDNDSSDGTAEEAARAGVTVIRAPSNRGAAGRTLGVEAARTPYVAFCDDDSSWAPGSLSRSAARFRATPRLGLLAARVLVEPGSREDPVCTALAAGPPSPAGPRVLGFLACGAVVRRSAYLAVGGFHPRFGIGGEEDLLAIDLAAAGWALAYVEAL